MDARIQQMIEDTKRKFGLASYTLKSYELYQHVSFLQETYYTLCMEWLPSQIESVEENVNPPGTAVIEVNIQTGKYTSAIFVKNKTYAVGGVKFEKLDYVSIAAWVEQETDVKFGENFQLFREEQGKVMFQKCIHHYRVSPNGMIEVHYDDEGQLTFFAVYGHFSRKEIVNENIFKVDLKNVEHLAKAQLKLVQFPSKETKSLVPVYALEEIFILNDESSTLPCDLYSYVNSITGLQKTLSWDFPLPQTFERREQDADHHITIEQAFSCEQAVDLLRITEEDQRKCEEAVLSFLRQQYAEDSNKWMLTTLYREKSLIQAVLKLKTPTDFIFQRKLLIMIDAASYEAVNAIDNLDLLNMFSDYKQLEEVHVSKQEAFLQLKEYMELKPYYVYDSSQKQYLLCGKLDSHYGIHASTGKLVDLNQI